jgi:membrane protease YdiL (CAAX protease family)
MDFNSLSWLLIPSIFIVGAFVFSGKGKTFQETLDYLRLKEGRRLFNLGPLALAIWAVVVCMLAGIALNYLIGAAGAKGGSAAVSAEMSLWSVPMLVGAVFLSPIAEELFFRGLLFRKLGNKYGWIAGALAVSALFGFLHYGYGALLEIVGAAAYSLVFCYMTEKTDSLFPAMLAHAGLNAVAVILVLIH